MPGEFTFKFTSGSIASFAPKNEYHSWYLSNLIDDSDMKNKISTHLSECICMNWSLYRGIYFQKYTPGGGNKKFMFGEKNEKKKRGKKKKIERKGEKGKRKGGKGEKEGKMLK